MVNNMDMNKRYIVVTSDDLQPETIILFEKYWKPLKEKHKNLQVTFFVAPYNQEFGQKENNNIENSEDFKKWYNENKSWCQVEMHGMDHTKPPEFLRGEKEQEFILGQSKKILSNYIDENCLGFRSPFFRMNKNTIKCLISSGVSWYSQWGYLSLLVPNKKHLPEFIEIYTHTNLAVANNPDNIDKVYNLVDEQLTKLEKYGFEYSTLRKIVKEVTS